MANANITINIVEPGSSTPIDPSTSIDPVVPNTGLFTHGIGGIEATIIISISVALIILTILAILSYRKYKKTGKVTKLVRIASQCKVVIKSKKRTTASLAALALLVSAGTFMTLTKNGVNATDTDDQAEDEQGLTVNVNSSDLTIEVGDEPVFAVLPVEVTVEEATQAGYTLTAYADNTDLVSTTNPDNKIPMVTVEGDELTSLTDNTWGLSLTEPEGKDSEVYTTLSIDETNPTILKSITDYTPTAANDTTTIYYGFYITPDIPYGTYTGKEVEYEATQNRTDLATVIFDGNGLVFDGDKTANVVKYEKSATDKTEFYSHTPNLNDAGEVIDPNNRMYPLLTENTFVYSFSDATRVHINLVKTGSDSCGVSESDGAYFSFWSGNHPDYKASVQADYERGIKAFGNTTGKYVFGLYATSSSLETDIEGDTVTWSYAVSNGGGSRGCSSGYGYYAIITATDADGNPAYTNGNVLYSGAYKTPSTTTYGNYEFLGWSLDPNATSASFTDAADIEANMALVAGEKVTIYAVWSPIVDVVYNGNNATAGSMESTSYNGDTPTTVTLAHEDVIAGDIIDLYAPNYKKTGYGFAGWSTDSNAWNNLTDTDEGNNPAIYGPNETFAPTKNMALAAEDENITLYAVWVPAEKNNGTPVALQGWTGCSNLTATTYNTETGKLSVGANTITALTDSRDGEVYTVARLADGNCWMTENLRLDNSATNISTTKEFSSTNTNNPSLPLTNNYVDQTTSNRLSVSSDNWCNDYNCFNQSQLNSFNTDLGGENAIASYNGNDYNGKAFQWYSYGNYYSWYSATAGNGTYSTGQQKIETVNGDVCPTGWHLPYGGSSTDEKGGNTNGGFYYLNQQMSKGQTAGDSNNWRSFPNNFVYSGNWRLSSARNRGKGSSYWSSTAPDYYSAYNPVFNHDNMSPGQSTDSKDMGKPVRCVVSIQ